MGNNNFINNNNGFNININGNVNVNNINFNNGNNFNNGFNGNNFNRLYSSTLKFSKIKEYDILLNDIKIPQLIESKTNGFNKSPFKFY